ncbi:MAG: hypothetical protein Q4F18_11320 [Clostridia bacterium]|nr:hypothetical protein [Clostridia bacterium]
MATSTSENLCNHPIQADAADSFAISYTAKAAGGHLHFRKSLQSPDSGGCSRFFRNFLIKQKRPVAASTSENLCNHLIQANAADFLAISYKAKAAGGHLYFRKTAANRPIQANAAVFFEISYTAKKSQIERSSRSGSPVSGAQS